MHLLYRQSCRVCGSRALANSIDLGKQYLQGSFLKPGTSMPPLRKIPTTLLRCDPTQDERACGLLQMSCSVPTQILYDKYWYRSGTNETMRNHLGGIAREAIEIVGRDGIAVLDIGCNDGTLLRAYPNSALRVGVEPSDAADGLEKEFTIVRDSFPTNKLRDSTGDKLFDVVTSIAMFYDLEDPVGFARSVKRLLSANGIWIFEMSYMPSMLRLNSYDTICHEHLEYYSLAVVENIVSRAGLRLFRVTLNESNGGSIRCYATHEGGDYYCSVDNGCLEQLRRDEFELELDTDTPYLDFQNRIEHHKTELIAALRELRSKGATIHIYGASTKGNTILQWCGIDNSIIDCAADRNPDKFGAITLGTNIPIVSEEQSREMRPNYYLVLPWHFREEFLKRERGSLERGVGMIFPLPKLEIIRA